MLRHQERFVISKRSVRLLKTDSGQQLYLLLSAKTFVVLDLIPWTRILPELSLTPGSLASIASVSALL